LAIAHIPRVLSLTAADRNLAGYSMLLPRRPRVQVAVAVRLSIYYAPGG
jgi:hypothetical protein